MADRGPNSDFMQLQGDPKAADATYRDASYLGTDEADEDEVRDLGFIVDDHDDRRITLTSDWQRLDDLDTNEPLEINRDGKIPHEVSLKEKGAPQDWFATDYHIDNQTAETQEEDFVQTSMLSADPDMNDGTDDYTDESLSSLDGATKATDIVGEVYGAAEGLGTSLPQDLGAGGFQVLVNPMPEDLEPPNPDEELSDYDEEDSEPGARMDMLATSPAPGSLKRDPNVPFP